MKKKRNLKNAPKDMFDVSTAASASECTGLIPTPVTSEAEAEAYEQLYDVYQPDGYHKPPKSGGK